MAQTSTPAAVGAEGGTGERLDREALRSALAPLPDENVRGGPGTYAFYCFVSDREGGPPHAVQGMISEVVVSE